MVVRVEALLEIESRELRTLVGTIVFLFASSLQYNGACTIYAGLRLREVGLPQLNDII